MDISAARAYLSALGWELIYLDSVGSTNAAAKEFAARGADRLLVLAGEQTAGRGRFGRQFFSPPGKGIYLSAVMRPPFEQAQLLTPMLAVAVCRALSRFGVDADIKWANDILCGGKKLCGILTETMLMPSGGFAAAVGIGLNLSHTVNDFPPSLEGTATSVLLERGDAPRAFDVLLALADELSALYGGGVLAPAEPYLDEYRRLCVTLGSDVTVVHKGAPVIGRAVGLDDSCALVVDSGGEFIRVVSGEATMHVRKEAQA